MGDIVIYPKFYHVKFGVKILHAKFQKVRNQYTHASMSVEFFLHQGTTKAMKKN